MPSFQNHSCLLSQKTVCLNNQIQYDISKKTDCVGQIKMKFEYKIAKHFEGFLQIVKPFLFLINDEYENISASCSDSCTAAAGFLWYQLESFCPL